MENADASSAKFLAIASALALLTVVDCGCGKPSTQSSKISDRQAGSNAGAPTGAVDASDESFTTAEYLRLGLPAPDKAWSADDMAKAAEILTRLRNKGLSIFPDTRAGGREKCSRG